MSHLTFWRKTAIALAFATACSLAHAFDITGRIKGTVTDPTGAAIPSVTVTATNEATGVKFTTTSSASGDYLFQALPVGTYTISVSTTGFKGFEAKGIILAIDQEYVEAVQLAVGSQGETLEVQADAVQVNTTDMQLNNIVTSAQMEELPLIGRGFTSLELILPGVQASSDRFGSFSADGAETQQSSYLINGADTNEFALNTVVLNPNLDAIDQFNLVTGPLNAEYDRNSGGIVNATIKQGTNHFHGDVFEFYRDTFLNTPNFFAYNSSTGTKTITPYHQNIFGGTIGGPILRDKLFFFGAYQGTHQKTPAGNGGGSTSVFSNAQRTGDFSDDLNFDAHGNCLSNFGYCFNASTIPGTLLPQLPNCTSADTWLSCAKRNNGIFPTATWNPIASSLFTKYVPAANNALNGYNFASIEPETINQYIARADYAMNPKNQFTGLYIYQKSQDTETIPFSGASLPGFGEIDSQITTQYTFDYTHQFTATLLNDFAVHVTRFVYNAVLPQNVVSPASLGFSIFPEDTAGESVPVINTGYFTLGFSNNGPQPRTDTVLQIDENLSKTFGHHNLKFGYDGRKYQISNPFGAQNNGNFGYSNTSFYGSGDPGLDFLLGNPSSYGQGSGAQISAFAYLTYLYAQDTWKVSNSFTFDYGLGYQVDTPLESMQYGGEGVACFIGNQQSKVFPGAPLGLNYPGDAGCTKSTAAYTRYGDFGPRIGFAYAPDLGFLSGGSAKKLSIRGGFGIYYNRTEEETALQTLETPPFGTSTGGVQDYVGNFGPNAQVAPEFANPYIDVNTGKLGGPNKFPFTFPKPGQNIDFTQFESNFYMDTYNANFRSPYAENFQLSIERELPSHIIARFSYVGSLGRHNQSVSEGNPVTPAGHAACLADTTFCASNQTTTYRDFHSYYFPDQLQYNTVDPRIGANAFAAIGVVGTEGVSNYNSFQASAEKGLSHGLIFQASYTLSHALDTASSFENSGFGGVRGYNQFQPSLNYGNSNFDARHRFVFAPIYTVPFKTGGGTFSPSNILLSGWQISGITTLATGFPFDISYGGSSSNALWCGASYSYYACPDEPNQISGMIRTNPRTRFANHSNNTSWFTPGSSNGMLAVAPIGTFGNESRDKYHGPGINNTNMILAKNFALSADGVRRLQIRMESDNAFNHTQFSNPASQVGATAAGKISNSGLGYIGSAASGRLTQLAAKIYF
jgi:hypothetical protein